MTGIFTRSVATIRAHWLSLGLLALTIIGTTGCEVRTYAPPPVVYTAPPRGHYYYDAYGRLVYVPGPAVVVAPAAPPAPVAPPAPAAVTTETPAVQQLEPLVAPIALYPDPLLAVVLPASTYPEQVQAAAAWLAANPNPAPEAIDAQPWDPSIKALVRYPDALNRMNADMPWTQSLGSAYTNSQTDVMAAVQQLRAQAAAQNNLVSNSQEAVVQNGGVIAIEPANPAVVYVPTYDPVLVYTAYSPLVFSVGLPIGPWFVYGFNWYGGALIVGDWHGPFLFEGGFWHRDLYWHADRFHAWARDGRFGPPPHVEHFAFAHDMRGHEGDLHRAMAEHAAVRHEHISKSMAAPHAGQTHGPGAGHESHGAGKPHEEKNSERH